MTRFLLLVCVVLSALIMGCVPWGRKPSPHVAAPTVQNPVAAASDNASDAIANHDAANGALQDADKERMAKVKANIEAARDGNEVTVESPMKTYVAGELKVGVERLSDIETDKDEALKAAERKVLLEKGKAEAAGLAYASAVAEAKAKVDEIVNLKVELNKAKEERDAARLAEQKAQRELILQGEKFKKEMEEKISAARNQTLREQSRWLTGAGILCCLICGLAISFGGVAGAKAAWPLGVLGLLAFGLAQIVSQPWFMPACAVAICVVLIVVGVWVYRHYKEGNLASEAQKRADKLGSIARQVIPVLDTAYDESAKEFKDFLDEKIFNPLSRYMDSTTKKAVHEVRAEITTNG